MIDHGPAATAGLGRDSREHIHGARYPRYRIDEEAEAYFLPLGADEEDWITAARSPDRRSDTSLPMPYNCCAFNRSQSHTE